MTMNSQQNQSHTADLRASLASRRPGSQRHSRAGVPIWVSRVGALLAYGGYAWGMWALWQAVQPHVSDDLTVRLAGRAVGAHHMREKLFDSGLWLLVVLPFVLYLEALIVGWPKAALRRILFERNASIRMDIGCILADQAQLLRTLGRLMTFGLSAAAGTWLHDEVAR